MKAAFEFHFQLFNFTFTDHEELLCIKNYFYSNKLFIIY